MNKCFIVDAFFNNFSSEGNGSVINLENVELTITCSAFQENTATMYGGSIFLSNTNFNISKTTFFHCQSSAKQNDISANAIYQKYGTSNIIDVSMLLCAKNKEILSDSSIKLTQTIAICKKMNQTSNYGIEGASGLSLWSTDKNSIVSYLNVYDIRDAAAIEANFKPFLVSSSNFVKFNDESTSIVHSSVDNLLTFNDCCFFETNGLKFSIGNRHVTLNNCITGENDLIGDSSFTHTISKSLIEINIDLKCRPIHRTCQNHISRNTSFKIVFFTLILIHK